jgi:hypothetical protein
VFCRHLLTVTGYIWSLSNLTASPPPPVFGTLGPCGQNSWCHGFKFRSQTVYSDWLVPLFLSVPPGKVNNNTSHYSFLPHPFLFITLHITWPCSVNFVKWIVERIILCISFNWYQGWLLFFTSSSMKDDWSFLWSSDQSSWLQIQTSVFDSQHYHIFWEVVGLERGPLSLANTIEELLDKKFSCSGLENRDYGHKGSAVLITCQSFIRKSYH